MFQKIKIRKMTISRALDKYLKTVSIHKKGHLQEFYRVNVIKRHPIAERYMDDITTVDIANYRDQRLAQINPRTGRQITGNTVRLELALLSSLFNIAQLKTRILQLIYLTVRGFLLLMAVNADSDIQ